MVVVLVSTLVVVVMDSMIGIQQAVFDFYEHFLIVLCRYELSITTNVLSLRRIVK